MRLTRFRVQGYKNLTAPVELTDLGPLVVLHGPNNVGKSNLIEAIGLGFRLLGTPLCWPDTPGRLRFEHSLIAEYPLSDIFALGPGPQPVQLEFTIDHDDGPTQVAIEIRAEGTEALWHISRFAHADTSDAARKPQQRSQAISVAKALVEAVRPGGREIQRFRLIDVHRQPHPNAAAETLRHRREIVDQQVLIDLYDAQESDDIAQRDQWTNFEVGLRKFADVLGSTKFRANFVRAEKRAGLVVERTPTGASRPDRLIPLRLLGTGIQQVITLLGTLATSGASIVAIEEPESNLSFGLQERLRAALREMAEDARAPHQIFVTSHAPGIELSDHFFNMQPGPDGPVVTRQKMSHASKATGLDAALAERPAGSAPLSYVTAEGLVRVPDDVREALGLQHGGGVVWLDAENGIRMVTDAQAMREAGLDDEP